MLFCESDNCFYNYHSHKSYRQTRENRLFCFINVDIRNTHIISHLSDMQIISPFRASVSRKKQLCRQWKVGRFPTVCSSLAEIDPSSVIEYKYTAKQSSWKSIDEEGSKSRLCLETLHFIAGEGGRMAKIACTLLLTFGRSAVILIHQGD